MPLITTAKPRSNITGLTTVAASHRVTSSNFFNDNSDSPIKSKKLSLMLNSTSLLRQP